MAALTSAALVIVLAAALIPEAAEAFPLTTRPSRPGPRADDRRLAISKYRNEPNAGDGAYRYE